MEGFSSWNVTVEALHLVSEAYTLCNNQLDKFNMSLPEFDKFVSVVTSTMGFVLTHSPAAVRQLYTLFTKLPLVEYNFVTVLLMLVLFYTIYSMVMAAFRWVRGLVFGFARFSLVIFIVYGLVYALQYFMDHTPTISSKTTTRSRNF